ncbi:MAG: hypothetical protein IPI87_19055 [Betaproteobacteria bacterium]|nr:hypothetical protein [Betaproteobacteria bacterium]
MFQAQGPATIAADFAQIRGNLSTCHRFFAADARARVEHRHPVRGILVVAVKPLIGGSSAQRWRLLSKRPPPPIPDGLSACSVIISPLSKFLNRRLADGRGRVDLQESRTSNEWASYRQRGGL